MIIQILSKPQGHHYPNKEVNEEFFLEKKIKKKSFKNGPKYFSFVNDIYTMATFFQKVSKPVFQNLTVERHVSTPHIRLAKVAENPNERTEHLVLTTRRT